MKSKPNIKNFNVFFFILYFVRLLQSINAKISISDFNYYNEVNDISVNLLETEYITILKIIGDGTTNTNFENSYDYLISDDEQDKYCNIIDKKLGNVIIKKNNDSNILLVQKTNSKTYIKDKINLCSTITPIKESIHTIQEVKTEDDHISVGDIEQCNDENIRIFTNYFDILNDIIISESEKCDQIIGPTFVKKIEVFNCRGIIGHIKDIQKLYNGTYYICMKDNNISLILSKIMIDKPIPTSTFVCNYRNPNCLIPINANIFSIVPITNDETVILKPNCADISSPYIKTNHKVDGAHYIFNFENNKEYYLEVCIKNMSKYVIAGYVFFLEPFNPITCFENSQCPVKVYIPKDKINDIEKNIKLVNLMWSDTECNQNKSADKKIISNIQKTDDTLYIISSNPIKNETTVCSNNDEYYIPLFTIHLIKNPEYKIHYTIINDVVFNTTKYLFEYNNYTGPYIKYECSHNLNVKDEYNSSVDNSDNELIHSLGKLNFNINENHAITMRLCLKQYNYYDIGFVQIERVRNLKNISFNPFLFEGSVVLYKDSIDTNISQFALKEHENCRSDKGHFLMSTSYTEGIEILNIHKYVSIYAKTNYKMDFQPKLNKSRYYLCMCSEGERCKLNNNLINYYTYTNIYIDNEVKDLKETVYICKLFYKCTFTIQFNSSQVSDKWIPKVGNSCNTNKIAYVGIEYKYNNILTDHKSNIIALDFNIYYNINEWNKNLFNTNIVACGNYNNQSFNIYIENDYFLIYHNIPNVEFDIVNINHNNLCNNKKDLYIYSYFNGQENLFKEIKIDEKTNHNRINLKIDYNDLKNNQLYFIKECHYCPNVLTYRHNEDHYIFQNTVKPPERYLGQIIYENNLTSPNMDNSINIYNCESSTKENYAVTSVIMFDGPVQEINFYCSINTNCTHIEQFYLLWYKYSLYIEVTETLRIIIVLHETPEKKLSPPNSFNTIKISKMILSLSSIKSTRMKPGPYKLIYSKNVNGVTVESYVGTFHHIGPHVHKNLVTDTANNILLEGYFKQIENDKIKIITYSTCNFHKLLTENSKPIENIDAFQKNILKNIHECKYNNDHTLMCNDVQITNRKIHLCWCYEISEKYCENLLNLQLTIIEYSPLESILNPVTQISKSSYFNFMNYQTDDYFFLIEKNCLDIKNLDLRSNLKDPNHIQEIYKKLKYPNKYNMCVCILKENILCDKTTDFSRLIVTVEPLSYQLIKKNVQGDFNTHGNIVHDFNFDLDFKDKLDQGIAPAIIILPGPTQYNSYICFSGVLCRTITYFKRIVRVDETYEFKKIQNNDEANKNEKKVDNANNKNIIKYANEVGEIYFTLNDTKECKNEYQKIYKSDPGTVVIVQEIQYLMHHLVDVIYDLKVNIVPPRIDKIYEICASLSLKDTNYYNVGNITFYGIFNENYNTNSSIGISGDGNIALDYSEVISGIPFSLEIKQFYTSYDIYIRIVYQQFGDGPSCHINNNTHEKIYSESIAHEFLLQHEKRNIEDNVTSHNWENIILSLDMDNTNYMISHKSIDIPQYILVCSCYEITEGHCRSHDMYSSEIMKYRMHTATLKSPKMNSTLKFLEPVSITLQTSKELGGSIKIFPIEMEADLSKSCLELNRRTFFIIYDQLDMNEYEQNYEIIIDFLTQGIVICWCPQYICNDNDYLTKVAFFRTNTPLFLKVDTDPTGYFSFNFLNNLININDRITFVDTNSSCTDNVHDNLFDNAIQIDNQTYSLSFEQKLNIYGTPQKIVKGINGNFIWVSKIYKIKKPEIGLKICYCFYFYNKSCNDINGYIYIGLVYNNMLMEKNIKNSDIIYKSPNINYFSKDSIKFVAINSFNKYTNVCNNRTHNNFVIIPFVKNEAFQYHDYKSRIINVFKKYYKNEINFVICYNSYYYGNKTTFLLKAIQHDDIPSYTDKINYNYELSQMGLLLDYKKTNINKQSDADSDYIEKIDASLKKFKQDKNIFNEYFYREISIKPQNASKINIYNNYQEYNNDNMPLDAKLKKLLSKFYDIQSVDSNELMYYKNIPSIFANFSIEKIIIINAKKVIFCCQEGEYVEVEIVEDNKYMIKKVPKIQQLLNKFKNYNPQLEQNIKDQNLILEQFNNLHYKTNRPYYLMIKDSTDIGFYKNHMITKLAKYNFSIQIKGENIPDHNFILYIIEFNNSCYTIDKKLFYVETSKYSNQNSKSITFKDIQISKINNYKLCILDTTENIYTDVGILNITNYYIVNDSYFDDDNIPSTSSQNNYAILNACVNMQYNNVYIIKKNRSFYFEIDVKNLMFLKKDNNFNKYFPELQQHYLISCKSKDKYTIILTKTHVFLYTLNHNNNTNEFYFSTSHNIMFAVDVDFDDDYIYISDLHLKKIARLQIMVNGIPTSIMNKRSKRSVIGIDQPNIKVLQKKMLNKGKLLKRYAMHAKTNDENNLQANHLMSSSNIYDTQHYYRSDILSPKLLINKKSHNFEQLKLKNCKKSETNNFDKQIMRTNLNCNSQIPQDTKQNKEIATFLQQYNNPIISNNVKKDFLKDKNIQIDSRENKFAYKDRKNPKESSISKIITTLYNYLKKTVSNISSSVYLYKILDHKEKSIISTFFNLFKKSKNKNNSYHNDAISLKIPDSIIIHEEKNAPNNSSIMNTTNLTRKKRSALQKLDQLNYDQIIQKNIENFVNIPNTEKYLLNNMDYLDIENLKSPLYMSIHDNILYLLDRTKNHFFSYNLKSKEIIELEKYKFSTHKFTLNNPFNFSIYEGNKIIHTEHTNKLAFVSQVNSNEVKIIDLNQNKYKIIKAIKLRKGYKKHHIINKVIPVNETLLIITSRGLNDNAITPHNYHYHFNLFSHYFQMSFSYTFSKRYTANDDLHIIPEIDKNSDDIIYFCFLNSSQKCTNVDELTKLNISHDTGIITGKLNYFGTFKLTIFAKTYFQYKINIYDDLYSYCGIGKNFNTNNHGCEGCPIGSFWNNDMLLCEKCDAYQKNTSTLKIGSKLITDCLCSAGYEYSEKTHSCEQCKPGYYKNRVGNFICIKGCKIYETSIIYGATNYDEMSCQCIEGYYMNNQKCVLCLKDHYCPGNGIITQCDKNETSQIGSSLKENCVCKENFIYNKENNNCTYCVSVAKVKSEPIYCKLCEEKYLNVDIFAVPHQNNYGLVNTTHYYYEDFILDRENVRYAYFNKKLERDENRKVQIDSKIPRNYANYINFIKFSDDDNKNDVPNEGNNAEDAIKFAIEVNAHNRTNCIFCESGYFIDSKKSKCLPCSNKYCRGFSKEPKNCPNNSIVNKKMASSILDCVCKRGYGTLNERRNGIKKSLTCKVCPKNFFKHNTTDEYCLPCPYKTYTLSEGSHSIRSCLPREGHFILMLRNINIAYLRYKFDSNMENTIYNYFQNNNKNFDDDVYDLFLNNNFEKVFQNLNNNTQKNNSINKKNGNKEEKLNPQADNNQNVANNKNDNNNKYNLNDLRNLGFLEPNLIYYLYSTLLKNIEDNYNWENDNNLNVICHINVHLKNNPNYTVTYTPNLNSCITSCKSNIYCTGVEFSRNQVEYEQIFLKNNQKIIVGYFKCKKFYYKDIYYYSSSNLEQFLNENVQNGVPIKNALAYKNFILGYKNKTIFTCSIDRDQKYLLYKQYQATECFAGKFCPGNNIPYLISCPNNSKTVVTLASNVDKCLCMEGYAYLGVLSHRCSICERGTYKHIVGNTKCENCPLTFSTIKIGSKNISDCSCTVGNYIEFDTLDNFIKTEQINYKNIDQYFIVPQKADDNIYYMTKAIKISLHNLNKKGDEEYINQILKLHIAVCRPCSLDNHYCEGGIESNVTFNNKLITNQFHTLPKKCPNELVIPQGIKQRSSIKNCLCVHGKVLRELKDNTLECFPCPPNTFKESEYDNSCSGVCPHFSTSFIGSSFENQCFCKNNYYLVTEKTHNIKSFNIKKSCEVCPKGAICNRGFNIDLFIKLLKNRAYNNITVFDHENPYPVYGYYAVYKTNNKNALWTPMDDKNNSRDDENAKNNTKNDNNTNFKYTYPYYNLILYIQKHVQNMNYFFFESNSKLYLDKTFIESTKNKNEMKNNNKHANASKSYNDMYNQYNAISFIQNENKYDTFKYKNDQSHNNRKENNIYTKQNINSNTTHHPTKADFYNLLAKQNQYLSFLESNKNIIKDTNNDTDNLIKEMFDNNLKEAKKITERNTQFERTPDIHPCNLPDRCLGTITNLCYEGSTGYQCNSCSKNYDMKYFKSKCTKCRNIYHEILSIILLKIIYYVIVIYTVSLNYNSCLNKLFVSGILFRIWLNCSFNFISLGLFSSNTLSFITRYWYVYKEIFLYHLKIFSPYIRVGCFMSYNTDITYKSIWYIQKYLNIFTLFFDIFFITLILFIIMKISNFWNRKKIQNFEIMLSAMPEVYDKFKIEQNEKRKIKNKKTKKIHTLDSNHENQEYGSQNSLTLIHDLEKNESQSDEYATHGDAQTFQSNRHDRNPHNGQNEEPHTLENNTNIPIEKKFNFLTKNKKLMSNNSKIENNLTEDNENIQDENYELQYIKKDHTMYSPFLNETVEYIYDKKMFGPWRFIHKKNDSFKKQFLEFISDTIPCYILMIIVSTPYILLETMQLFYCKSIKFKSQKSELYLAYLTTQKCTTSSASFMMGLIVAFIVLLFYITIWILLLYLYSKRKQIKLFDKFLNNLLSGYGQGKEIFEVIFLFKNIILVVIIAFTIYYHYYYIVLVTLTLTLFSILEIISNPFDRRSFNILNISLRVGSVLNIFFSIMIWGSFYLNYERYIMFPFFIVILYHFYMVHNIIKEVILSKYFLTMPNSINAQTVGYDDHTIKDKNYKFYYKVMNKIKFVLKNSQKESIMQYAQNYNSIEKTDNQPKEYIHFEAIENIIKKYNDNLKKTVIRNRDQNEEIIDNEKKDIKGKENSSLKKKQLSVNMCNVAYIWYDEQNEDLFFQMPFEDKLSSRFNKEPDEKTYNIFSRILYYIKDKKTKHNIKYFVLAIMQVIDKFVVISKSCSIYENWFDFAMRFAFVYISWIKRIHKNNIIIPNNIDQLHAITDEFIYIPLFYKYEYSTCPPKPFYESPKEEKDDVPNNDEEGNYRTETLEKMNSFQNTEIKISRSYGSYSKMNSLKNRKKSKGKMDCFNEQNSREDLSNGNDTNSSNLVRGNTKEYKSEHFSNNSQSVNSSKGDNNSSNEENSIIKHLNIKESKKRSKSKGKTNILNKKINSNDDGSKIDNIVNKASLNTFNYSLDIFSSEMFNESNYHMLISLFELYIAMNTLKTMNSHSFSKLYKLYNKKYISFEKNLTFYINNLRNEIKQKANEIDNEIDNEANKEKFDEQIKIQNYYYYKEELVKRKNIEGELLSKIKNLEDCIEANKRSREIRDLLRNSRNNNEPNENLADNINFIFSFLQNEGTYKLDHSKKKE
ncbi:cysteine repeat modular protein 4, putative [Plasmodium chabaudi adami]|uniref:Cysteine repeat modular protein 4, putative n=1 Tax=Plasmodium chabaudi adami TaxID=5826 RepID=A0A1C6XT82_PLACE|nr:cysteine repeat modular protein 4, putative [Plasmodium chabaudi adami]